MSAGDLITSDLQVEFNGQLLGDDASGLEIVSFSPFDSPEMRSTDLPRPLDHGLFPGTDYYGGRSIVLQLETWGGWAAMRRAIAAFSTADEAALVWQMPDLGKLQVNCRVRRRSGLGLDQRFAVGESATCAVEFFATDPRVYSNTVKTAVASLASAGSGMTFNATFNLTFGSATSPTTMVVNDGTFETRPVIRITGAVDAPYLTNETTGETLAFSGSLASGEYLDVDFLNRTVLLNGDSSRYSWVIDSSGWWKLMPGSNSIRLGGSPGSPTPTATVSWRDAYA